jgi:Cu-Zn family superoxide dismutase
MQILRRLLVAGLVLGCFLALALGTVVGSGALHARATIVDATGSTIGWASLVEDATGRVHVNVQVRGLTPGLHGIHIHAVGLCDGPAFTTAGGHYNPTGAQHGLANPGGPHAGDLPNLVVNEAGVGRLQVTTDRVAIAPASILDVNGSAFIIHAFVDDQVSQPIGNSGARISCGVIEAD